MTKPKITKGWSPGHNRTGLMTMLVENGHERHYQTANWYVADDEEAAANAQFYGAAQKMAELMRELHEIYDGLAVTQRAGRGFFWWMVREFTPRMKEVLLEAGYTDPPSESFSQLNL